MSRWMIVLSLVAIGASQGVLMATPFCPSSNPGEILCEDFDTYCTSGEYPGGAGVTKGAQCDVDAALTGGTVDPDPTAPPLISNLEDDYLRTVWPVSSTALPCKFGANGQLDPCTPVNLVVPPLDPMPPMPELYLDNLVMPYLDLRTPPQPPDPYNPWDYYASSRPYGARIPSFGIKDGVLTPLPQQHFKDPSTGEYNISRFTANSFGDSKYRAVIGTDTEPLVLTFMLGSREDGKIGYSNGYIELGYGDPADHLNRANTDYVWSSNCNTVCNGLVTHTFYPVICDIWNPNDGFRREGCPDPTIDPPPLHNAIAIGVLPMTNPGSADGPCYCTSAHGGTNWHPVMFNGQMWYDIRNNTPVSGQTTRTVTMLDGSPTTPFPNWLPFELKDFVLWSNPVEGETTSLTPGIERPYNWLTLTIKSTTATLTHFQIRKNKDTGIVYRITDTMPNIPITYSGPFDSIRIGVGPGCVLEQDGSWNCTSGATRTNYSARMAQGRWVEFDDISLYGGKGWNAEGACCLTTGGGTCLDDMLPADCLTLGGTFKGGSTVCDDPDIYCCPIPYADSDGDGDVDMDDFAALQVCMTTGDALVGGVPTNIIATGKCNCFDRNGDDEVNEADVTLFANCATGPGIELGGECP